MNSSGWIRQVFWPFLISRLGLLLVGVMALGLLGSARARMPGNLIAHEPTVLPLEIWARWDAEWYLLIARRGYDAPEQLSSYSLDYHPEDTTGFFPLYPMSIRALTWLGIPPVAAGVLLSNLALLLALSFLRSILLDTGRTEGSVGRTSWVLLAFPTSFFFSAVYTEALFLCLVLAGFWLTHREHWGWLALVGFLCALTRPTGCLVAPALGWEVWTKKAGWRGWGGLLGFPAGLAVFAIYCGRQFGDPWVWASRQTRWRGATLWPGQAFARFFDQSPQIHGAHNSLFEFFLAILVLVLLVPLVCRTRVSWSIFALLTVLIPLSSTLWSFSRLVLPCFPLFVLIGDAGEKEDRLTAAYFFLALPLSGLLMALFACGWWAG